MLPDVLYITDLMGRTLQADSQNEYFFAIALQRERIPFIYQYAVKGGHMLPGGAVLDFMCFNPFRIGVEIVGAYWHRNTSRDRFRYAIIESFLGRPIQDISEEESATVDAAVMAVRKYLE